MKNERFVQQRYDEWMNRTSIFMENCNSGRCKRFSAKYLIMRLIVKTRRIKKWS